MKKLIYNKFDKLTIPSLKRVEYSGKIIVIYTTSEAEKAVDFLLSQPLLVVAATPRSGYRDASSLLEGQAFQVRTPAGGHAVTVLPLQNESDRHVSCCRQTFSRHKGYESRTGLEQ